jgi:hypothetical protein
MSYLADTSAHSSQHSRSRAMWLILGALVVGQLFAFWLLCSHQVRKAEARSNEVLVHQMALSDCLQYIPGSTIASCSKRIAPDAQLAGNPTVTGAVPVSFSYR